VGQLGRGRLVPARLQVRPQRPEQLLARVLGVVPQQRPQFPLDEGLQARLVAQQVQQAGQADVGQPVHGHAGPRPAVVPERVRDLPGLLERAARLARSGHPGAGGDDQPAAQPVGEPFDRPYLVVTGSQGEQDADRLVVQRPGQAGELGLTQRLPGRLGQVAQPGGALLLAARLHHHADEEPALQRYTQSLGS
jgi:hypothetical protein